MTTSRPDCEDNVIVGLQYCGSCDPDWDLPEVIHVLAEEAARASVEFVGARDRKKEAALVVQACTRQCFLPDDGDSVPMRMLVVSPSFGERGLQEVRDVIGALAEDARRVAWKT